MNKQEATNQECKPMTSKKASMKAKFSEEEDKVLREIVLSHGACEWSNIALSLPGRTARQCRDRWTNYLNPLLCNKEWTEEEDTLLMEMYKEFGTHWKDLSIFFNNRSLNNVRNRVLMLERRNKSKKHKKHNEKVKDAPKNKDKVEITQEDDTENKEFDFKDLDLSFLNGSNEYGKFEDWILPNL